MSAPQPDLVAGAVLQHYAAQIANARLTALGNQGGFSGAQLWHIAPSPYPLPLAGGEGRVRGSTAGAFCLRAWPPEQPPPKQLEWIHALMMRARQAGLRFVPRVVPSRRGRTWVWHAARLWEVTTWQPGRADFHAQPTRGRLEAACTALAHLHRAWADVAPRVGPCPAIRRRLERAREWGQLVQAGWQPRFKSTDVDPVVPWARRLWPLLRTQWEWVPRILQPYVGWTTTLQPCLGDIWHDHVLFEGEQVTGIVDYGGVAVDHVAVDLARLLGSFVGDQAAPWAAGLSSYARQRPLSWEEDRLVTVLDQTGTFLGAANWLKWLYWERKAFDDRAAVARRLAQLVERLPAKRWVALSQRLENWNALRAPLRPYFLRSFMRPSRVR